MQSFSSILNTIGNTPLIKVEETSFYRVFAKLESKNPASSVKDRIALSLIEDLETKNLIKEDSILIEATSGNTGIGLSMIAALKGYPITIVMPESASEERKKLLRTYGATLILTPREKGMPGAVAHMNSLIESDSRYIPLKQFSSPANPMIHEHTTAVEIWNQLNGKVHAFVAGIGTGGTITGVARFLKRKNPSIKIVGLEPASSPFLTSGQSGPHKIQGIGAGFKPEVLDLSLIDKIITVKDEEAFAATKSLAKRGILVGISSGACFHGSSIVGESFKENLFDIKQKRKSEYKFNIVTIFADSGERYISTGVFDD